MDQMRNKCKWNQVIMDNINKTQNIIRNMAFVFAYRMKEKKTNKLKKCPEFRMIERKYFFKFYTQNQSQVA
jgi:hypothetical protein